MASLNYVPGEFVYDDDYRHAPTIVFVGEAPGQAEEEQLRPFVGRSGKYLREVLAELRVDSYYLTNAIKVRPEGNRRPTKGELETWAPLLEQELTNLKYSAERPLMIFALGESADWAMRCMDTTFQYHKVWHPSYVVRFGKHKDFIKTFKVLLEEGRSDY